MGLLTEMRAASLERAATARERVPEAALRAALLATSPPLPLRLSPEGFDVIAELKLRSPSSGDLSGTTRDLVRRLEAYAAGGAVACSILTEPTRFDGDVEHLRLAAATLRPLGVPAMRKDFLVDPYQVIEARVHGASGVLLIVRLVSRPLLEEMLDVAAALGMFVLLEAFDAEDLELAASLAAERSGRDEQVLMGLNCRDLESLDIQFGRFDSLRSLLPPRWPAVAESGVQTTGDAALVASLGYRLALVGTSLMRRPDPELALRELICVGREARR